MLNCLHIGIHFILDVEHEMCHDFLIVIYLEYILYVYVSCLKQKAKLEVFNCLYLNILGRLVEISVNQTSVFGFYLEK